MLLDHLTWQVGPGDRVGIAGVNGSGKTSLLRLLVGELAPCGGQGRARGHGARRRTSRRTSPSWTPPLRVLEAVEAGPP